MLRPVILVSACSILLASLVVTAQQQQLLPPQQPAQQTPVFKTSIDLVHLDVSVLDKDRRPVRGLTEADFTVTEDGKPQSIMAFSAVDVPANPPKPAAWSGRAPADVQTNEGIDDPEGRLFVLLIDDAMIPPLPAALKSAREVAVKFLDRITPSDRVAVVFSASGRNQDFTSDRARLVSAIESLKSGHASHLMGWDTAKDPASPVYLLMPAEIPGPAGDPDIPFRAASMQTLRQVAETLISAPDRRKALVFISPGIGLDALSAAVPTQRGLEQLMAIKDAHRQLLKDMPDLFTRMQRANVTIYSVDPCGAGGFEQYVMSAAANLPSLRPGDTEANNITGPDNAHMRTPITSSTFDWLNPGYQVPRPDQLATHQSILTRDFLETAASNTGGRAIVNTNAFDEGLDSIFEENSSYYLLGYQQPAGQVPGSQHRISVKVNRPDVFVRTRSGYSVPEAPKPNKSGKVVPLSALDSAIVGALPDGAFPMRVAFAPFLVPGKKDPVVTVALGLAQPAVNSRTAYTVDLQTNAYTIDGRPKLVGQRHTASVVLVPTNGKDRARYELLSSISLPPGRYQLRLSAHRGLDNVNGSLYADVEIPDFTAPLAVSGTVIETVPTSATAPIDAFDKFLPVVPTSNREFRKGQEVTAFMRIYQGGTGSISTVEVKTRLVNESDASVGDGRDMVYGNQFHVGGRAADYRFAIPVNSLPPGLYLLTFDISLDKTTITRSVQFRIAK